MDFLRRSVRASYRLGLRLLGTSARERYGAEMLQMLDDGWDDLQGFDRFRFLTGAFVGLLATAEPLTVVGVVADVRQRGPSRPPGGEVHVPWVRLASPSVTLMIRSDEEVRTLVDSFESLITDLLPGVVMREPALMSAAMARSTFAERVTSRMVTALALLAVALAAVGVHGLVAFTTMRRAWEIGLQMALGASAQRVRVGIVGRASHFILSGLGIGLALGLLGLEAIRPAIYWLPPRDLATPLLGVAAFAVLGLGAAYLPTWRLTRMDPLTALRAD